MVEEKDIYEKLSELVDVFGYPRYVAILREQLTPEEAELIVGLGEGKTSEELMKKLNVDEKTLSERIEDLVKRRIVRRSKEGVYSIPQTPRFFYRNGDTPKLQELWHDFFHSGDYPQIHVDHIKARSNTTGRRSHKIIPARQALLASHNLNKDNILWYEDMGQIFSRAKSITQAGGRINTICSTR
jgi:DNA-binding HxlR family transcriptional regulator